MEFIYQLALLLHIIGGFTAIVVLWIPIFTCGIYRLLREAGAGADDAAFSWFLIFIAILSGAAAWHGIRVLRFKQRNTAHRKAIDLFFPILLLISSIAVSLLGWKIDFPLLQYFPLIGLFL